MLQGLVRRFNTISSYCGIAFAGIFLFAPWFAFAQASLFIMPNDGTYHAGELFSVLITVNTGGEAINAASAQVNFDNTHLDVESIGFSRSIFSLWAEEPTFSNIGGTIRFSGGVPNPGYTGASGGILRITFKAKTAGQAPIEFISGSVLANDGKGTNILDTLKGGLYTILTTETKSANQGSRASTTPAFLEQNGRQLTTPIITDWPKELEEGSPMTIKGLGYPNSKIVVYVQSGSRDPITDERLTGDDGRFVYDYSQQVLPGLYRIWVKNVTADGGVSGPSDTILIEVLQPFFLRIGNLAISYMSLIMTLLALLFLFLIMAVWVWRKARKWQERQGKEISEAEQALHHGFDKLKDGLAAYVDYLTETRSVTETKRRKEATKKELKKELEDIEEDIHKEIEDVKISKKK